MTDLEKAERWIGVTVRQALRTVCEALPGAQEEDLRPGIENLWLDLHNRRIRKSAAQSYIEKRRLAALTKART